MKTQRLFLFSTYNIVLFILKALSVIPKLRTKLLVSC